MRQWADRSERTKIGFDPVKEPDRPKNTRAYIGAKTKKMQSRVKQMEERIDREIEEKEGLLQDIENPVDLKLFCAAASQGGLADGEGLWNDISFCKSTCVSKSESGIVSGGAGLFARKKWMRKIQSDTGGPSGCILDRERQQRYVQRQLCGETDCSRRHRG